MRLKEDAGKDIEMKQNRKVLASSVGVKIPAEDCGLLLDNYIGAAVNAVFALGLFVLALAYGAG